MMIFSLAGPRESERNPWGRALELAAHGLGVLNMIQICYRVPKGYRPTRNELTAWRNRWALGKALPEFVKMEVTDWKSPEASMDDLRAELRRRKTVRSVAGIVAHYAEPDTAMCDFDKRSIRPEARIWTLCRLLKIRPKFVEYRRTKRGWHVRVKFNRRFKPAEMVAVQLIIGSDGFRELFNLARILDSVAPLPSPRWNLLFREKIV